jgi:hypothetical protein
MPAGDTLSRNPTTGIAARYVRAASGHLAAECPRASGSPPKLSVNAEIRRGQPSATTAIRLGIFALASALRNAIFVSLIHI